MSNLQFTPIFRAFSAKTILLFVLALACLGGCSRTYDWRTVQSEDGAYEAMFPSKPNRTERTIVALGEKYLMTMEVAKAGNALFAVSVVKVGKDDKNADAVLVWLKEQTRKTLKVVSEVKEDSNLSFDVANNSKEKLVGTGMKISGNGPDDLPRYFWVRWVKRIDPTGQIKIYQISIIQSLHKKLDEQAFKQLQEEYETFYAGFHPY